MQTLGGGTLKVGRDFRLLSRFVVGGVFCCDDHLVAVVTGFHPFTNPYLRFLVLVIVGTVMPGSIMY